MPSGRRHAIIGPSLTGRLRMVRGGASAEVAMLKEFREFAMRGNVVDLAIGIVIGVAFGAIVTSLVGDIFMPIIGAVTGGLDFSNYFTALSSKVTADSLVEAKKQGAVLAWGNFLTVAINFVIIAFILFLIVKGINRMKKQQPEEPAKPPEPTREEVLLTEIRDTLRAKP
jgi:large conductance mechanosensitive channel